MSERVVDAGLDVRWQPNSEMGILLATEGGFAQLRLLPHPDDADRRDVVLVWEGVRAARLEGPNDESRSGHRLAAAGLADVMWVGEVQQSGLIAELEAANRGHPRHDPAQYEALRHWIVLLKGRVAEVIARTCRVDRDVERRR